MKRAFVIGHPIGHSRSPMIHRYWLGLYGIAGSYDPFEVSPDDLNGFLERLRSGEFVGGNVTLPHKSAALALADDRDPLAESIGAANTLVRTSQGEIQAFNTDYEGFLANLDAAVPGWDATRPRVVVLGAGGAARSVLVALKSRDVDVIHLLNRTLSRAEDLAIDMEGRIEAGTLDEFGTCAGAATLVVNTTSVGLGGSSFAALDLSLLPRNALVTDIVYVPLTTPFLAAARDRGLRTIDGLGMLLHQAVAGFEKWFGVRPEVTPELRALVETSL